MRKISYSAVLVFVLVFVSHASGQITSSTIFQHLQGAQNHEITLHLNFDTLAAYRNLDSKFPAALHYVDAQGQQRIWNIKTEIRGRFRRKFCDFPPLKLNFSKKDLLAGGFMPIDDIKMVTHCLEDASGETNLFKEYLVYDMYRKISPYSFETHWLKVTYVNSANPTERMVKYAFIIEPDEQLAQRHQLEECKDCLVPLPKELEEQAESMVAVFQFMIGNNDWSTVSGQKNVKFFRKKDQSLLIPVPYDFDFSVLVGATYKTKDGMILSAPKHRRYKGVAVSEQTLKYSLNQLIRRRKAMTETIDAFPLLDVKAKREMIQYLNEFFNNYDLASIQN
jgi:hypothetical protein